METQPRLLRWRIHRSTIIILTLVGGVFLWLNLRPTKYQDLMNMLPPDDLDPLTRTLFYRGWPLSPFMLCPIHGMKYHPEEGSPRLALILDALVALLTIIAVGYVTEWWMRRGSRSSPLSGSPVEAEA